MTGRSELSRGSEAHSQAGLNRQADTSPAAQLGLVRGEMVPSLDSVESVSPPSTIATPGASASRLNAREWIRGFHVTPVAGASELVAARSLANPSESGLLEVASSGDVGIQMPAVTVHDARAGISQSRSGLLVAHENPADARLKTGSGALVVPSDADTKKYGKVEDKEGDAVTPRSPTEIAVALATPNHFLAREIKKRLPEQVHKAVLSVVDVLDAEKDEWIGGSDSSHLLRQTKEKKFTCVSDGEEQVYMTTTPGPFEQVALIAVDLLDDPEVKPQADQVVFKPLMDLARYYRKWYKFGLDDRLPTMPELTSALIDRLDQFPQDKQARAGIYGILQQVQMPPSDRDKIAQKMYDHQDLDHPWATKLGHPFVAKRVAELLDSDPSEDIELMLNALREQNKELLHGDKLSASVLKRDWKRDENDQAITTVPGEFERTGLAILSVLNEPDLPPHADEHVLLTLSKLMRDFRVHSIMHTHYGFTLPEMPDLTDALVKKLYAYPTEPVMRNRIYGILEQVKLPVAEQEALIAKMDAAGDLDHPLAFSLTHSLAQVKPDSEWIRTQTERRTALYERLNGTNQELFEQFDELLELSRGLVYSGDVVYPRYGKVGLEIEVKEDKLIADEAYHRGWPKDRIAEEKGLDPNEWMFGIDGSGVLEIRKANNPASLFHNNDYLNSLLTLYRWIGDYTTSVQDMHLHFDRRQHPHMPVIGHMLDGYTVGRETIANSSVTRSRHHQTYEVRGIFPPHGFGNIHPGRIEDVINMYIAATQSDTSIRTTNLLQVPFTADEPSVKQLTWGHIVTFLPDASGRLAALMAMHDEVALANVNPLSFANSYDKDSLLLVLDAIEGKFKAESDQEMIAALELFATSDNWQEEIKEFLFSSIMFDVLGITRPSNFLDEGDWNDIMVPDFQPWNDTQPTGVITLEMQTDSGQAENNTRRERVEGTGERIHTRGRRMPEYDRLHYQMWDHERNRPETPEADREELQNEVFFTERLEPRDIQNEPPYFVPDTQRRADALAGLVNARFADEETLHERVEEFLALRRQETQENERNRTEE